MIVDQRSLLGGLAAAPAFVPASVRSDHFGPNPRNSATGLVRLQGSLDPQIVSPWWYEAAIYGVTERAAPLLLLRAEGCEIYAMRREPGGQFRSRAASVTVFKPVEGDRWVDTFDNPFTRLRNAVRPNILTGARFVYPADGSVPLPDGQGGPAATGWVRWMASGAMVGCIMERKSGGSLQPFMETTSIWTDAAPFMDRTAAIDEATFSSTFMAPWFGWMGMGDAPGHMVWHSTGRKMRVLDDLPTRYRSRAEELAPGVLSRDPFA